MDLDRSIVMRETYTEVFWDPVELLCFFLTKLTQWTTFLRTQLKIEIIDVKNKFFSLEKMVSIALLAQLRFFSEVMDGIIHCEKISAKMTRVWSYAAEFLESITQELRGLWLRSVYLRDTSVESLNKASHEIALPVHHSSIFNAVEFRHRDRRVRAKG